MTSNERPTSSNHLENHLDIKSMLLQMKKELDNIKRKNVEEMETLHKENMYLKRRLENQDTPLETAKLETREVKCVK